VVVHQQINARSIAEQIAGQVRNERDVREVWLHEASDFLDLWIITGQIDDETELRLYDLTGDVLGNVPTGRLRLHVLHPGMFADGTDLRALVTRAAKRIDLQR
jgi:hypothetical protein